MYILLQIILIFASIFLSSTDLHPGIFVPLSGVPRCPSDVHVFEMYIPFGQLIQSGMFHEFAVDCENKGFYFAFFHRVRKVLDFY